VLHDYTQPAGSCTSALGTAFSYGENEGGTPDGVHRPQRETREEWHTGASSSEYRMIAINAHYDGEVIVPDEPLDPSA
jgi:hypothetical protein